MFLTLGIAFKSMTTNKVRTALTVLGMVIGIASVIIVYSAGEGVSSLIVGQVESFGTDIIQTEVKVPSSKKGGEAESQNVSAIAMGVQITTLNLEDLEDIEKLTNITEGYAGITGQEKVGYGNESRKSIIFGTNASYIDIDASEIKFGRFFSEQEDKSLSKVVVLGSKMKIKLFGESDPIGKSISLHKSKFKVIGVMEERGAMMTMDFDDFIYVPIRTLQKRVMGIDHVLYMVHQVINLDIVDETAEEIRVILRENHDITDPIKDDFRVTTMIEMLDMLGVITGALTLLLLAIVAISLVVGGVGIMNIMYVIVTERTSEIGLRKAVGAKYNEIMMQFLFESVLITILGGIVGVIVGYIISYAIAVFANRYGLDWDFIVPVKAYVVALGFSTFFGVVFGLYPARKAAKLDPITALRKE